MDKNKIKSIRVHDRFRANAVKDTAAFYQCTESYVREIINGKYEGGRADEIRRRYNKRYAEYKKLSTI